ncbi:hypothetical protein J2X16_001814 [Pelomonas aquatica]|uniref:Uncharacterized protein n=1 Tax=Pelomonas aquatica TaxID=431058 RepID=A0ABU1Z8Z4_9BURK|nr:hypothetical protein [Pelomonas aquatica]MDR7296475.1 hypothetical protein [Pelomonas aquatica]
MKHVITAFVILLASQASASQCKMKSPEEISKETEIAFVGTVTLIEESTYKPSNLCWERSEKAPQCGGKLVTLKVSENLRGELGSSATVVSEDGCYCLGSYWKVGSSYLIVAKPNDTSVPGQVMAVNGCSGTGELSERTQPIVKVLRSAKP